jgi:hypothetical protein
VIEPGLEIFLGFILAICGYFALTQDFAKIIGAVGIVLFLLATLVAFSNNDIGGIITNYAFFGLGNVFGAVGVAIFNGVLKPLLDRIG